MSLALSIRRARASASIFSSAWKFSTRIRRTTSRARVSSRTSASLRPTSRLTTASDIRPATSSLRAMPEETGYTDANRGVKHNYPENRSKLAVEAGEKQAKPGAFPGQALDLDAATVGLGEGLHEAEAEPQTPGGRRLRMGDPHVLVEDAGQLLSRDADAIVLDRHLDHSRVVRRRTGRHVDSTAPRRVLHRIGQEVLHHTIQRVRIHLDGRPGRAGGPAEAVAAMLGREQLDVALQPRVEIDRPAGQRAGARGRAVHLFRQLLGEPLLAQRESRVLHGEPDVQGQLVGPRPRGAWQLGDPLDRDCADDAGPRHERQRDPAQRTRSRQLVDAEAGIVEQVQARDRLAAGPRVGGWGLAI